ncbi:MAG TPA: hypothetical protein VLM79_14655, partial [Kofleriaceae bacterium]|nr:hypothetical protein [Kofleriaceae bacterium]
MTRRSRIALAALIAAAVAAIAAWSGIDRWRSARAPARSSSGPAAAATGSAAPGKPRATGRDPGPHGGRSAAMSIEPGGVAVAGKVIDIEQQQPVGGVEVVFRGAAGESTTTSRRDGGYEIRVPAGRYHAFVRDDAVLSIGRPDRVRLPTLPSAETAGIPDEALMASVNAREDLEGVDLGVVRGGVVNGRVIDRSGRPVAAAVLRARGGNLRPALATDVAESDATGAFEL